MLTIFWRTNEEDFSLRYLVHQNQHDTWRQYDSRKKFVHIEQQRELPAEHKHVDIIIHHKQTMSNSYQSTKYKPTSHHKSIQNHTKRKAQLLYKHIEKMKTT